MKKANTQPATGKEPMAGHEFAEALSGEQEIQITVVRAKNGKKHTLPIWFTLQGAKLQMLPMYGLKTVWFRDYEKRGMMTVSAKGLSKEVVPEIIRDVAMVEMAKRTFGEKYGTSDVKRYYPTSEVMLEVILD